MKQKPLIRENVLTGGWSVITKYRKRGKCIEAIEKFDVTDQIEQIVAIVNARGDSLPRDLLPKEGA